MADHSHIQWTDATWNTITGCTKISAGCDHCYIERTPPFRMGPAAARRLRHNPRPGRPQQGGVMSIQPKSCFEVVCDGGCDDPWEEGTPHFSSIDDAVDTVRSYGWVVVGDRALCPDCAAEEGCELTGHQWPDRWHDAVQEGVAFRYQYCEHCNQSRHEPPWLDLVALVAAAEVVNGTADRNGEAG